MKDHSDILLFLLAFSQETIDQKVDCLIQVLEGPDSDKTIANGENPASLIESENISKERAAEILHKLLLITTVEILEAIQGTTYLSESEKYS